MQLVGHARIAISATGCAVRFTRQIPAFAVVALYIAQVVSGRAAHLSLCSTSGVCVSDAHCRVTPETPCHGPSHGVHCDRDDQDSPVKRRSHRRSGCWVCQVLGQAQDRPTAPETVLSSRASPVPTPARPTFYGSAVSAGFHSRGPPLTQA